MLQGIDIKYIAYSQKIALLELSSYFIFAYRL